MTCTIQHRHNDIDNKTSTLDAIQHRQSTQYYIDKMCATTSTKTCAPTSTLVSVEIFGVDVGAYVFVDVLWFVDVASMLVRVTKPGFVDDGAKTKDAHLLHT